MHTTSDSRRTTRRNSDPDFPADLDPEIYPIIAQHFYGLELREVREVYWSLARQGHPPPAESNVILIPGGRA